MSKRILLLIVVVILVLLAAPYAIGMFTESRLNEWVDNFNQNPAYAASVESYERGWRTSRVELDIGVSESYLEGLGAPAQGLAQMLVPTLRDLSIPFVVEMEHGPLLMSDGFGLGTAQVRAQVDDEWQIAQMAEQLLGIPYLFELRGRSGFGTGFHYEGEIPGFEGASPDFDYSFSGLEFTGRQRGQDTQIEGMIENAGLQAPNMSAILESLSFSGDYAFSPNQLPTGSARFEIEQLTASNPLLGGDPQIAASGLLLESSVAENEAAAVFELEARYSAETLAVAEIFAVDDAAVGVGISNIDAEAAQAYYALMRDPDAFSDPLALPAQLTPLLDQIVAGSPALALDPIAFSMPDGDFDGQLHVSVDGSALPTGQAADLQNIAIMMQALDASLEMTVAKALAEQFAAFGLRTQLETAGSPTSEPLTPGEIDAMAQAQSGQVLLALAAQGILTDDGETYSTMIEFADGTATANGQAIPLGAFGL